ncbi:sporulation protein Cse60 [Bacillus sp. Marseille-P3661]|uniref:sporulation protein Cse60 n=1 Tax=Bacillus sp. Marseille-P3661 TaxID=1936234 RepID=UPI000C83FD94|nr:sporulation protein Cse60 [Bacillus sp. Marseille-P3661]
MLQVKVFDEEHEKDLEDSVNEFLAIVSEDQVVDIQFRVAVTNEEESDQIYCFSAMIVYRS